MDGLRVGCLYFSLREYISAAEHLNKYLKRNTADASVVELIEICENNIHENDFMYWLNKMETTAKKITKQLEHFAVDDSIESICKQNGYLNTVEQSRFETESRFMLNEFFGHFRGQIALQATSVLLEKEQQSNQYEILILPLVLLATQTSGVFNRTSGCFKHVHYWSRTFTFMIEIYGTI